jgi:3-hydroxy-9,10-secoandrosta-1,3,5(10)-triene-9,17-dione monooxygenase
MSGMRGTGSDTLVADRVFVPSEHVRPFPESLADSSELVYRIPLGSMATLTLTGTLLGTAQAILEHTMTVVTSGKPLTGSTYRRLADSPGVQANLADAANLIDSARLHLYRSAWHVDRTEPGLLDLAARARVRMDVGHASRTLREAATLLLNVSGAGSFATANPVQRYWRDLETACRHPALNAELSREIYGRALVGRTEQVTDVV